MPKVLVIDDEKAIDSVIKEILEAEQFVVDEGSNGAEALDKIQKKQFREDFISSFECNIYCNPFIKLVVKGYS